MTTYYGYVVDPGYLHVVEVEEGTGRGWVLVHSLKSNLPLYVSRMEKYGPKALPANWIMV